MNSHPENKWEAYQMAEAWNLTPDGPVPCTTHVISRHVAMAVKCLYGETDALTLPRGWAKDNKEIFEGWFEKTRLIIF